MKQKHLFSLLDTTCTTIRVVFPKDEREQDWNNRKVQDRFGDESLKLPPKTYVYKASKAAGLVVGDYVVVETERGMAVVRVAEVHGSAQIDVDADFDYKWIVQKVDRSEYDAQSGKEAAFSMMMLEVERTRQREVLLDDMRKHLPDGSEARRLFEQATTLALGSVGQAAPEAPLGGQKVEGA